MAEGRSLVGCVELLGDRWAEGTFGPSPPVASMPAIRATQWPVGTEGGERWIQWPWITHSTFWAYERALAWLADADRAWEGKPDFLFGSWVAVMTAQLFDAPDDTQPFDSPTQPVATEWTGLCERLATLEADPRATAWLDAVGLLCTPEMGMKNLTDIPALLPSSRADGVHALRKERAKYLPPRARELAQSWPPTSTPPIKDQATARTDNDIQGEVEDQHTVAADEQGPKNAKPKRGSTPRTSAKRARSAKTSTSGGDQP
jgi:hypothetical protein